jgi:hypothetical protein
MTKLLCSLWLLLSCLFLQAGPAMPVPGSFVPAWHADTASGWNVDYDVQNEPAKSKYDYDAALMLSTGEKKLASLATRPLIGNFVKLEAAKGGVQYGTAGDAFLANASRATQPAGMLDVAVHGSPLSVEIGANTVNHRVLAGLIERNAQFAGQPVRLLSCETGCLPNGFAQNLANKLGVPVHAPNDIIWAYPSGRLTIGPTAGANSGSFVPFLPGGGRP